MAKVAVYDMSGNTCGEMELSDAIFGVEINTHVMHEVVVAHLANRRQGTQSAKTRAEVRGGGKKPYRQKGTGRARQGSIRAPQWVGGGVVFAPKPRDYSKKVNKKARRVAFRADQQGAGREVHCSESAEPGSDQDKGNEEGFGCISD